MAVRLQGRDSEAQDSTFPGLIMKLQHSEGPQPTSKEKAVAEKQSLLSHKHLLPECRCSSCHRP